MNFTGTIKKLVVFCCLFFAAITATAQNQDTCCNPPDSLKIVSVTTSQFCVSWKNKDSANCDSTVGAVLQYRPVGFRFWLTATITYSPGTTTYTYCASITPCTTYEWKVKTECVKNGITTYSSFVSGPNFTAPCFQSNRPQAQNKLKVHLWPNPVIDQLLLQFENTNGTANKITVSDESGRVLMVRNYIAAEKFTAIKIDVSQFSSGIYFIKIDNNRQSLVNTFVKQ